MTLAHYNFSHLLLTFFTPMWSSVPGRYLDNKMPFTAKWTKWCTLLDFDNSYNADSISKGLDQLAHVFSLISDFAMCIRHPRIVDIFLKRYLISIVGVPTDNAYFQRILRPWGITHITLIYVIRSFKCYPARGIIRVIISFYPFLLSLWNTCIYKFFKKEITEEMTSFRNYLQMSLDFS